jgi:hypothetical protein
MTVFRLHLVGVRDGTDVSLVTPAFESDIPLTILDGPAVAQDLRDKFQGALTDLTVFQPDDFLWTVARAFIIDQLDGSEQLVGEADINLPGQQSALAAVAFDAVFAALPCIGIPRSAKMFLPALMRGDSQGQVWSAALLTEAFQFAATWVAPFVGGLTGATFTSGVWSTALLNFFVAQGFQTVGQAISHRVTRRVGRGQ